MTKYEEGSGNFIYVLDHGILYPESAEKHFPTREPAYSLWTKFVWLVQAAINDIKEIFTK
jgi:hypothetical protein